MFDRTRYIFLYKINYSLFAPDLTPEEQSAHTSGLNEQREITADDENRMEVNCNGHAATPENETSLEVRGTEQCTEEQEDQQDAKQPESNKETDNAFCDKEERPSCNGNSDTEQQRPPASLSPDSVTVELKEGDKIEEQMDTLKETKRENEEENSQDG